jgi:ketosteroid isomerase-like protein
VPGRHADTIRDGMAGFNRGDLSWAKTEVAEDVEWGTTGAFPGLEGVYRGPDAIEEWMETVRAEWEEFEVTLAEILREEEDAIAVVERLWGRGRMSGAEAEMRVYSLYRFTADGKVASREVFMSPEDALAAL